MSSQPKPRDDRDWCATSSRTPPKHGAPPVQVELSRAGGRIALRVSDHGPGVPAAERARVFEPFYRPTGRARGGRELGLSIVRQIAERHGRRVTCAAGPVGGGASFVADRPAPLRRSDEIGADLSAKAGSRAFLVCWSAERTFDFRAAAETGRSPAARGALPGRRHRQHPEGVVSRHLVLSRRLATMLLVAGGGAYACLK